MKRGRTHEGVWVVGVAMLPERADDHRKASYR